MLILFKFNIFIIFCCYFEEITMPRVPTVGIRHAEQLGSKLVKGMLNTGVETIGTKIMTKTPTTFENATTKNIQNTTKHFLNKQVPPPIHPLHQPPPRIPQHQQQNHLIVEHLHPNSPPTKPNPRHISLPSTFNGKIQQKNGLASINDIIETKIPMSTGILQKQNNIQQKNVEQAQKTLKDLVSKMGEKITKLNNEEIENIIGKIKDSKDTFDKMKNSLPNTPNSSFENPNIQL
ncbi:hypothetical protein Mgra_00002476 [Meloidogyne graminicola]|uniref:Uncharacterized protein n=1 Tax=Meloidogyne graminicola TaxID=189291 RepID=A0A8S9ZYN0_9BILA|nr:hypothetical protein Mgra_00002476 [Meloidogyne graminicola]